MYSHKTMEKCKLEHPEMYKKAQSYNEHKKFNDFREIEEKNFL